MNDLTSELPELANVDAHSASPVGVPFVPDNAPHSFYPPLSGSGIELRVIRDGAPARRLRINATRCTFGSGEGCTVRLDDGSLQPMHAVILREGSRVLLRSHTAAIEINGQLKAEAQLDCGDVFRLGSYRFETLSLPQSPADPIQDQAQRLRFMTSPDPELEAARQREQQTRQLLAESQQQYEQAQSQLEATHQIVAELQQQIDSLQQQIEVLVAETQTLQADAETQAAELQQQLDSARQDAETLQQQHAAVRRERDTALQQRDRAQNDYAHALASRDEAILQRDTAQQQILMAERQRDQALQQRDEARQQLDQAQQLHQEAVCQRDQALQQRDEAVQQRDEAVRQRDEAMARRSDAIDSEQAAQAKLRQLNQQILQLQQAQAAAESEKLNELSLEAYMSRLLQQMERSPGAVGNRSVQRDPLHQDTAELLSSPVQSQLPPYAAAEESVFCNDTADEPVASLSSAEASPIQSAASELPTAEPQLQRRPAAHLVPPPATPPRPSPWSSALQVVAVFSCCLIFFYCGNRNPDLRVVWHTASALAAGLVLFAVYDLLAKSLRRSANLPISVRPAVSHGDQRSLG